MRNTRDCSSNSVGVIDANVLRRALTTLDRRPDESLEATSPSKPREHLTEVEESELTVFVCDDAEAVRNRLVRMLRKLPGIRIAGEASRASSSVELISELKPDVVVLDIKLPDGNGMEVLRRIKQTHPAVTVIMLTNHANALYRRACLAAGASHFFDKSTEFGAVASVLSEIRRRQKPNHRDGPAAH